MTCFLYRWRISQAIDGGLGIGPAIVGHVATCKSCETFLLDSRQLDRDLRRGDADGIESGVSSRLHADIMRAARTGVPSEGHPRILGPVVAVAVVAVVLMALGYVNFIALPRGHKQQSDYAAAETLAAYGTQVRIVATETPLLMSSPLEREMEYLVDDVNRAALYLLAKLN